MIGLLISLLFLITPSPIVAIEASSSANDIQSIREVVQQKVKEKLNIITTPSSKPKAFFGSIKKISGFQIDINQNNENKTIITTEETVFVNLKKTKSNLKELKVGDEILAIGYLNSQGQLEVKRIVVIELSKVKNNTQIINGQIVDVSQNSPVFVIVPLNNKNSQYQIETDSNTIKKITTGQKIIAVIKPDEKITNTFNLLKIVSSTSISTNSATVTPKQ